MADWPMSGKVEFDNGATGTVSRCDHCKTWRFDGYTCDGCEAKRYRDAAKEIRGHMLLLSSALQKWER